MKKTQLNCFMACLLVFSMPAVNVVAQESGSTHAEKDSIANLADLYAFVDPHCQAVAGSGCEADPIELIVALTLNRGATVSDRFSEDVVYHFYFENDSSHKAQIDCSFDTDQVMTCSGMNGLSASAPVGETGINGDLRVFAGLRDDPMFFDLDAFTSFNQIGIPAYPGAGVDSLAGTNVLAIVIGIKITAMAPGSTANHNVQKIWAASERVDGDGINGAFTGSWYDPDQNGQGWVVEIVGRASGQQEFLSFFYGYDDMGEQLWLITGASVIDGNQVTADLYRTSAAGFGAAFDPGSFALGDVVGSVTFEFESCDSGTVTFTAAGGSELTDFESDVIRLSNIATMECVLLQGGQVDRVGRPFISESIPEGMRDDYGSNSDPDTWFIAYRPEILATLNRFATADGDPAWNGFYTAAIWADIFADDRLQIDVKKAQSVGYLTLELSQLVPQDWNDSAGRALDYDVHEGFFNSMITSFDPFIEDNIHANDVPLLEVFPFLAPPHQ